MGRAVYGVGAGLASPSTREVVITSPHIPGLELHLPRHTVITDHEGEVVREVSITPIPVDRPPFPLPAGVEVPVYFTIQPGGAYLTTHAYGSGRKGPWLVYPNYYGKPPGTRGRFWHYDPEEKGWYVYGMGRVSPDGGQAVPDVDVALYEFTGAMHDQTQSPGPDGGNGPRGGDPVDLGTGQFVMEKTDLALQDVIPLALTRTYRPADNASRAFWDRDDAPVRDLPLVGEPVSGRGPDPARWQADPLRPDQRWDRLYGCGYEHTSSPTAFYGSRVVWNGNGWDLTTRDGTVYVFGNETPLQAIRDRFGNTVQLTWSQTNAFGSGYGNIQKVTAPTGRFITFTYDGFDRITQAKDSIGRTVGVRVRRVGAPVEGARRGVTEYTYDIAHRLLTISARGRGERAKRVEPQRAGVGPRERQERTRGTSSISRTSTTPPGV